MESLLVQDKTKLNLYFDEYKYKAVLKMPGIEWFRYITSEKKYYDRLNFSLNSYRLGIIKDVKKITIKDWLIDNYPDMIAPIKNFISWRSETKQASVKIVITYSRVKIYTNNLETIKPLISNISVINYVNPIHNFEKNVVYHKNPKHKYRIYFKHKKFDSDESANFVKFIEKHAFTCSRNFKKTIYPKNATVSNYWRSISVGWNKSTSVYLFEDHFIDFDDDELLTIIAISYPEIIRKICRIEKIKEA